VPAQEPNGHFSVIFENDGPVSEEARVAPRMAHLCLPCAWQHAGSGDRALAPNAGASNGALKRHSSSVASKRRTPYFTREIHRDISSDGSRPQPRIVESKPRNVGERQKVITEALFSLTFYI